MVARGARESPQQRACPLSGPPSPAAGRRARGEGALFPRLSAGGVAVASPFCSPRCRRGHPPRGLGVQLEGFIVRPSAEFVLGFPALTCAQRPGALGAGREQRERPCLEPHPAGCLTCTPLVCIRHDRKGEGKGLGLTGCALSPGPLGTRGFRKCQLVSILLEPRLGSPTDICIDLSLCTSADQQDPVSQRDSWVSNFIPFLFLLSCGLRLCVGDAHHATTFGSATVV